MTNQYTYQLDNSMSDMHLVLKMFRHGFRTIGGIKVECVLDHSNDAIEYHLAGGPSVEIRPSGFEGAEPKIEVYISIEGDDTESSAADKGIESASEIEKRIREDIESIIYMDNRMGYCCE